MITLITTKREQERLQGEIVLYIHGGGYKALENVLERKFLYGMDIQISACKDIPNMESQTGHGKPLEITCYSALACCWILNTPQRASGLPSSTP